MLHLLFNAHNCLLFAAAIVGGMFNGIAGGGSFISFPALIFTGLAPIEANATSTLAMWFGAVASSFVYRKALLPPTAAESDSPSPDHPPIDRPTIYALSAVSLVGGIIGSQLLLVFPAKTFSQVVPYLMIFATALFACSPRLTQWLRSGKTPRLPWIATLLLQLAIAIYGGYFGAGVGILMLATMSLMGLSHIHAMNGLKSTLGSCMNGVAIVTFGLAQKIAWFPAILMGMGAICGSYLSAKIAQKVPEATVRQVILGVAGMMTIYLFSQQ
jgi:uncharacterized protein